MAPSDNDDWLDVLDKELEQCGRRAATRAADVQKFAMTDLQVMVGLSIVAHLRRLDERLAKMGERHAKAAQPETPDEAV